MGVIMYEVFSGSLPFQGESFMGILTQHITSDPEPVVQRAAKAGRQLPPGMAEIISRCMQKDPQRRFATMDELVAALVEVYRAISGAGMSTYMAAFPVQPSGAHASQPSMPGTPQRSIPTMMAGSMAAPGSQPVPAYVPQASATAPAVPGALRDSGASSYAAAPAASVGMAASDSLSVPARGSKAPLIILLTLLLLGGGGAAYYFLVYAKKATPTTVAGAGSGSAIVDAGSGSAVLAAGSGSAIVNAGSGSAVLAAGSGSGAGSGSAVALVVDAGLPPPDAAPAVAVIDAPSAPAVQVSVLVKANAPRAKFFDGTRQVGDRGSAMVKVTPGVPLVLRVEASDYKDATVTVDGSTDQLDVKLEKKATTSSGGNGSGSGTVVRPPDPDPPKTECADKWKDKTKACKKAFCEANPGNLKCLE
jgi:hypothetical protein